MAQLYRRQFKDFGRFFSVTKVKSLIRKTIALKLLLKLRVLSRIKIRLVPKSFEEILSHSGLKALRIKKFVLINTELKL